MLSLVTGFPKSKVILLLSILSLVFVSGCVGGENKSSSSSALVVEAFEPDIRGIPINPGEELQFSLIVRNTGSEEAKEVSIDVVGLDGWEYVKWTGGCKSGDFLSGSNIATGKIAKLSPPNPEFSTPGESRQCILQLKAPKDLPLDQSFQPKLSIRYNYNSVTIGRIAVPSREKVVIRQDSGQTLDSETIFKSSSPIDIDLSTRGQGSQVRVSSGEVKFPLFITINNLGGGFVCSKPGDCSNTRKKIPLDIEAKSSLLKVDAKCLEKAREIDLFRGQRGEIKCDMTVQKSSDKLIDDLVSVEVKSPLYAYTIEYPGQSVTVKRKV